MKKIILFSLILGLITNCINLKAQSGAIDLSFNTTDYGFGFGDGANSYVRASVLQSDGKIFIAGHFTSYNGTIRNGVARLNADGSLDSTFIPEPVVNDIYSVIIQNDEKIIIGGGRLFRLNPNGSLDSTFNIGNTNGVATEIRATAIQNDGKIIVGGDFTNFNGLSINHITRLNSDGSIDTTFHTGVGTNNNIRSIVIQNDGKIIIGGFFITYDGVSCNRIIRLNNNGSIDTTFNTGIGPNSAVNAIALQSNQKINIVGEFSSYNGIPRKYIARLNTDGSLDTTLNVGTGANSNLFSVQVQSDGKILFGGNFTSYNGNVKNKIARLNIDGSLDNTFNEGTGSNSTVRTILVLNDGKIVLGGDFTFFDNLTRNYVACLNSDGSLNLQFNEVTGANGIINATKIQNDGKIVIGGTFTIFNGIPLKRIARLNENGTVDSTFNSGFGANYDITSLAIQNDGKIIVGGDFTSFNGVAKKRIIRLNSSGIIDSTFNPGTGANLKIRTISIQSDGKIIIGGDFTTFNGLSKNRIVRLNSNGSVDTTFNIGSGAGGWIYSITLQNDGKIILGGDFLSYNGTSRSHIARLNSNGSLDLTFNPGSGATNLAVYSTAIQSDGKIFIGGAFGAYNGIARTRIARLNTDGSLDISFNPGTGANDAIYTFNIQNDDKIIIAGFFTTYDGISLNHIARLNTNGTLDSTFNIGTGASNTVLTSTIQSNGRIIIGGYFTDYNGIGRNRIARIFGSCNNTTTNSIYETACNNYTFNGTTYTSSGIYTQTFINTEGCDSIITLNLTIINSTQSFLTQTTCDNYTLNGTTYTITGTYTQMLINSSGCDSTIVLNLTVNSNSSSSITEFACESLTLNGIMYDSSGIYTQILLNEAGCDSIIFINLTINNSTFAGTDSIDFVCSNSNPIINLFAYVGSNYSLNGTWQDIDNSEALNGSIFTTNIVIQSTNYHFSYVTSSLFPCSNDTSYVTLFVDICGKINDNYNEDVIIFPNPTKDNIIIKGLNIDNIEIINLYGQVIENTKISTKDNIFNLSQLLSGVYTMKIKTDNKIIVKKLIKQ